MLEVLVQDTGEFRYSRVLPVVQKGCKTLWKLSGANNFLLRKKKPQPLQEGQVAWKKLYFVTMPKVNSK